MSEGLRLLACGRDALDAVEQAIRRVEDNEDDWTVGTGGLPNLLGEVELDASIMEGRTLRCGAVAGMKHHKNPITIARKVMELTPHALLVGEGADRFADVLGFARDVLLTPNASDLHADLLADKGIQKRSYDTDETLRRKARYSTAFKRLVEDADLMRWYARYARENHGTVNILAQDGRGDIVGGVSTSGLSFKFPGRVGDSAVIGAGNYADNRYGAAACVGVGEIAIRLSLSRMAVHALARGATVEDAATSAIESIAQLEPDAGSLAILVMGKTGAAVSAANFRPCHYWFGDAETPRPVRRESIYVPPAREDTGGLGYHR